MTAHRIGLDKPVFVYKLIAKGTVEEAMVNLQDNKRELPGAFMDGNSSSGPGITSDELREIFAQAS